MATHTIKVVSARTGIRPVTLRAWERRFQLLTPGRTPANYRLYSDRDVTILRWVKSRVDRGEPISKVAAELRAMPPSGPWLDELATVPAASPTGSNATPAELSQRLFDALTSLNEFEASRIVGEASRQLDPNTVALHILQPCLVAIGDAWRRGAIRIATEHFASQFVRGQLLSNFQALPIQRHGPRIIVGCAPNEFHDIGALMLAYFIRRAGYPVEYLGANIDLADLVEYARTERPALVCLSANSEASARRLRDLQHQFDQLQPAPRLGYGGLIFNLKPKWREEVPGLFLGTNAAEAVASIRALLPKPRRTA